MVAPTGSPNYGVWVSSEEINSSTDFKQQNTNAHKLIVLNDGTWVTVSEDAVRDLIVSYSTDDGATWSDFGTVIDVAPPVGGWLVHYDPENELIWVVAAPSNDYLSFKVLTWNGSTFTIEADVDYTIGGPLVTAITGMAFSYTQHDDSDYAYLIHVGDHDGGESVQYAQYRISTSALSVGEVTGSITGVSGLDAGAGSFVQEARHYPHALASEIASIEGKALALFTEQSLGGVPFRFGYATGTGLPTAAEFTNAQAYDIAADSLNRESGVAWYDQAADEYRLMAYNRVDDAFSLYSRSNTDMAQASAVAWTETLASKPTGFPAINDIDSDTLRGVYDPLNDTVWYVWFDTNNVTIEYASYDVAADTWSAITTWNEAVAAAASDGQIQGDAATMVGWTNYDADHSVIGIQYIEYDGADFYLAWLELANTTGSTDSFVGWGIPMGIA